MTIEELFFELLQVAVGTRKSLSRVPTAREWGELYSMATRQALIGVAFAGVNHLRGDGDFVASIGIPEALYLKWLGMTVKVQQRNRMMNEECVAVTKQLVHDGLACCVLKGQ